MADYTNTKTGPGDVFQDNVVESDWMASGPLITPQQVISRHLWGIPLVSALVDPDTMKPQRMTTDDIAALIDDAISQIELETGLTIFPSACDERHPFDMNHYDCFGYMKVNKRPVASIEALLVTPSNDIDVFQVPNEWISTAYLHQGQLNIVPLATSLLTGATASTSPATTATGAAFMAIFGRSARWIPSFWKVKYTAGFPQGKIPKVVNQLIGCVTAMEVLSMLASTNARVQGQSLSMDGLSQSTSTPGPQVYKERLADLAAKRAMLTKKLKAKFGLTLFSNHV